MTTVVTGFSPEGYRDYGEKMLATFDAYWPTDVSLLVYCETPSVNLYRGVRRPYPVGMIDFLSVYGDNAYARGEKQRDGWAWKKKDLRRGYSFRYDAVKFCKMAFYVKHAAETIDDDLLVWFDGDTYTHKPVPEKWIESLFPADTDLLYLGREPYHSETGFVAFKRPAFEIARLWGDYYRSGLVFHEREWHSAYVFDRAREASPHIRCHNLTPGGKKHVWHQSPLSEYTDHVKGRKRKALGYSPERKA